MPKCCKKDCVNFSAIRNDCHRNPQPPELEDLGEIEVKDFGYVHAMYCPEYEKDKE